MGVRKRVGWLAVAVSLTLASASWAQQWSRSYRVGYYGQANCVRQTADGGYIVAGQVAFWADAEAWVIRLDAAGEVIWERNYGGAGNEYVQAVEQTPDGGFVLAGRTNSFGFGNDDAWVFKLDPDGSVIWQRTFGGVAGDTAVSVGVTAEGAYVVAGQTESFGAGASDVWLLKIDPLGNVIWEKTFGGVGWDGARSVQATSDGGFVLAGSTADEFGGSDGWIVKLSSTGAIEWQEALGGQGEQSFGSVCQTRDGGFAVGGTTRGFLGLDWQGWIVRMDSVGNILWQKDFQGTGLVSIAELGLAPDDGLVATGTFERDTVQYFARWVVRLDQTGAMVWQVGYAQYPNNYEWATSVRATADGGFVFAGTGELPTGALVLKLNALGEIPGCFERVQPGITIAEAAMPARVTAAAVGSQDVSTISVAGGGWTSCETEALCYQPQMTVSISTHGTGSGSVRCDPSPVDLGFTSTCTATPAVGSSFVTATTTCTGTMQGANPFTIGPVNADCAVDAEFVLNSYQVSVVVNNTAWGSAICAPNPATYGATVECHAEPNRGYGVESISGCGGEQSGENFSFVATADCTVTVVFALQPEQIPTMSWWGLGSMAGVFAVLGLLALRRYVP